MLTSGIIQNTRQHCLHCRLASIGPGTKC